MSNEFITIIDTVTGERETSALLTVESEAELNRMFDLIGSGTDAADVHNIIVMERAAWKKKREEFLTFARQDAIGRNFFNQY